ncbi:hypothetical protein ACKKBF_B32530 [Auxenochlorella protothecoides x Auxenochlorella symbiontica]
MPRPLIGVWLQELGKTMKACLCANAFVLAPWPGIWATGSRSIAAHIRHHMRGGELHAHPSHGRLRPVTPLLARRVTSAAAPAVSASDPLLTQLTAALEWETRHGCANTLGSRGQAFCDWATAAMDSLGARDVAASTRLLGYEAAGAAQRLDTCRGLRAWVARATGNSATSALPDDEHASPATPPPGMGASAPKSAGKNAGPARQPAAVPRGRNGLVIPSTDDFKVTFAAAAAAGAGPPPLAAVQSQGSQAWHEARSARLTASAFSKALGFFPGDRETLWKEKLGLLPPFQGNDATRWGTGAEARALQSYQRNTGYVVQGCAFAVKADDAVHGWLGASPDGLVEAGAGPPGLLEIKCPFNKGAPEEAWPPQHAIWYYMPQIQGQMEIMDREWCDLYVWTPANGAAAFRIPRDRAYWAACFDVLAEFWWAHVVPARLALDGGREEGLEGMAPPPQHPATEWLKAESQYLARAAPRAFHPPDRSA